MTHATELHFKDGQVIVEGGHDISAVYRVKSGKISIFRNGHKCCELTQVLLIKLNFNEKFKLTPNNVGIFYWRCIVVK